MAGEGRFPYAHLSNVLGVLREIVGTDSALNVAFASDLPSGSAPQT